MSQTLAPTTPTNMRISGITSFQVNGSTLQVVEFAWNPASVEQKAVTSLSGVDGFDAKPAVPYISGKFRDNRAVSVTGFTNLTDATVVVGLANGKQIVGHNLWYAGLPAVSGADASFDFRFEGIGGSIMEVGGPT